MQKRIHKLYENKNSVHKLCKIFTKSYEVKILRHKILIEKKRKGMPGPTPWLLRSPW